MSLSPAPVRRPIAGLRLVLVAAVTLLCLVTTARPAAAHALVTGTEPRADARVTAMPERVAVHMVKKEATRAGDPIQVFDPDGVRIDNGENLISEAGTTISVGLRPGTRRSGTYNVVYKITSADTHIINGRFTFSLVPMSNEPMAQTAGAGAGDTVRTGAASSRAATNGRLRVVGPPGGTYLGAGLVVVAFIALVVMVVRRRRHPAEDAPAPGFRVVSTGEHRLSPAIRPSLPAPGAPRAPHLGSGRPAGPAPGPSVPLPRPNWPGPGPQPTRPTSRAR